MEEAPLIKKDSLDSMEGVPQPERTTLPELKLLIEQESLSFSEDRRSIKKWVYTLPNLENAMLSVRVQRSSGEDFLYIDVSLWDVHGEPLDDLDLKLVDGNAQALGDFSKGRILKIKPENMINGFWIEKKGTRMPVIYNSIYSK